MSKPIHKPVVEREPAALETAEELKQLAAPQQDVLYCPHCGESMEVDQRFCTNCGWDEQHPDQEPPDPAPDAISSPRDLGTPSEKNRLTALLLCILLGFLGAHRFYVGRNGSALVWLVTLGVFGVGVVYDAVLIATGELKDVDGRRVLHWQ